MYSGLTGLKLTAWLSLSYRVPLTDAHTLRIRPTLLTNCGTLSQRSHFCAPDPSCPPRTGHVWVSRRVKELQTWREIITSELWWATRTRGSTSPCSSASLKSAENSLSCEHPQALAHTQTCRQRISLYKYFLIDPTMILNTEFYFPFFLRLISLSIMHLRRLHCPTILLFATQKNIFVNGSIISAVSLLVHRKFPFWTGTHSFCCTIVHFMACHTKKKSFLFYFFQGSYYYNSLKSGFHFIYTTSLG